MEHRVWKKRKKKGKRSLFLFSIISNVDKQKKGTRVNEREIPENDREKKQTEWGERVGRLEEGRSRVTIVHNSVSESVCVRPRGCCVIDLTEVRVFDIVNN